jgi:hypothetical protein
VEELFGGDVAAVAVVAVSSDEGMAAPEHNDAGGYQ